MNPLTQHYMFSILLSLFSPLHKSRGGPAFVSNKNGAWYELQLERDGGSPSSGGSRGGGGSGAVVYKARRTHLALVPFAATVGGRGSASTNSSRRVGGAGAPRAATAAPRRPVAGE